MFLCVKIKNVQQYGVAQAGKNSAVWVVLRCYPVLQPIISQNNLNEYVRQPKNISKQPKNISK